MWGGDRRDAGSGSDCHWPARASPYDGAGAPHYAGFNAYLAWLNCLGRMTYHSRLFFYFWQTRKIISSSQCLDLLVPLLVPKTGGSCERGGRISERHLPLRPYCSLA